MSTLTRRDRGDLVGWFNRMDQMFDEWMRSLPMRRPFGVSWEWPGHEFIEVDEFREGSTEIIRAELPGIDPEKDIELTVAEGMLRIKAERRVEDKTEDRGYTRHELRYGSFVRTLPLPVGASESDIIASYKDGILELRIPVSEQVTGPEPTKIAIAKG